VKKNRFQAFVLLQMQLAPLRCGPPSRYNTQQLVGHWRGQLASSPTNDESLTGVVPGEGDEGEVGGWVKLNPVDPHSLQPPGFNPCTYQVISLFQAFAFELKLVPLTPRGLT
jgi:hypothetical protein